MCAKKSTRTAGALGTRGHVTGHRDIGTSGHREIGMQDAGRSSQWVRRYPTRSRSWRTLYDNVKYLTLSANTTKKEAAKRTEKHKKM